MQFYQQSRVLDIFSSFDSSKCLEVTEEINDSNKIGNDNKNNLDNKA